MFNLFKSMYKKKLGNTIIELGRNGFARCHRHTSSGAVKDYQKYNILLIEAITATSLQNFKTVISH